ncbi:MAG: hypothetical protein R3C46_14755 [Hyphomonadaceae bacterium]
MIKFEDHWRKLLGAAQDNGDIIASIREEAINHYLEKHFDLDKPKYSVIRTIVGKIADATGAVRDVPITMTVSAKSPLIMDFAPIKSAASVSGNWTDVPSPEATPNLSQGNIGVRTDKVQFQLEWKSVYSPGQTFSWKPSPVLFEAEGYVELITIEEPTEESRHALKLQVLRARFDRPSVSVVEKELQDLIAKLPAADAAIVKKHAVEKFDELLVVALNTAAIEVAPRFAASVEIPVTVVAQKRLTPRALLVSDNIVTVSFGLAEDQLRMEADAALKRAQVEIMSALEEDIEAAGGLRNLVVDQPDRVAWDDLEALRKVVILPPDEVAVRLTRTQGASRRYGERAQREIQIADTAAKGNPTKATVNDGVGIALNEYLLDSIAATFARSSPKECTAWLDLVGVRGRACYWARLYDPDVDVDQSGGTLVVGGKVSVDVGGSLEGCVRKFWDCSWKWACSEIRMAVVGRPQIDLSLLQNKYIAFSARIRGALQLETNLPFPFDKIAAAVSRLVWEAIKAVLNVFLAQIQIVLVPPKFEIPKQETGMALSNFAPSYFVYNGGGAPKERYAAYSVGLTAGKV